MNIVGAYLGHNSSMTVAVDGVVLEVVEFERMTNIKNCGSIAQMSVQNPLTLISLVKLYFMEKYNIKHFDLVLLNHLDMRTLREKFFSSDADILRFFNAMRYELVHHQHGHMACAFYQSDLKYAKGVSFDGGGSDGNFNVFECDRIGGIKQLQVIPNHTLGMRYAELGQYAKSIRKEQSFWDGEGGLVYPGKLMGLASYGTVRQEWISAFQDFYTGTYSNELNHNYNILKSTLNLPDEYDGQLEVDLIATSQYVFEKKFDELVRPHFENETDFILTGGCAMNILNNQSMRKGRKIFVPPNPHDGGLSLGFVLDYLKPKTAFDGTYAGPPVWDKHTLPEYVEKYNAKIFTNQEIVKDLIDGKIIGVVRGGSELGPRALGNRSIICHAAVPGMKDILNAKVKHRESYRPFAPVCRVDEAHKFFELNGFDENRWMSFCPKVKQQYREALSSVTHVDGTARLQTVKDFQNDFLYFILTVMSEQHEYPVLLNTSFNIAGKPILNTYKDAVWMLENTEMDGLILEDYYIKKS